MIALDYFESVVILVVGEHSIVVPLSVKRV